MLFRLALAFGCTIRELSERMTSTEFTEWCAFFSMEPWGYDIENWRAGMIGSTVANVNRPAKTAPYKIEQFTPQKKRLANSPKQTPEQMRAALAARFKYISPKS